MRDFRTNPIRESITIHAPIARCFALSTRVELVKETLGMDLVADPAPHYIASGHIVAQSRVHWRGWKFGLPTHHHTLITGYTAPHPDPRHGHHRRLVPGLPGQRPLRLLPARPPLL